MIKKSEAQIKTKWHKWFAWRPICIELRDDDKGEITRTWVWRELVYRIRICNWSLGCLYGHDDITQRWQYALTSSNIDFSEDGRVQL